MSGSVSGSGCGGGVVLEDIGARRNADDGSLARGRGADEGERRWRACYARDKVGERELRRSRVSIVAGK